MSTLNREIGMIVAEEHQRRVGIVLEARSAFQRAFARPFDDQLPLDVAAGESGQMLNTSASFQNHFSSSSLSLSASSPTCSVRDLMRPRGGIRRLVNSFAALRNNVRAAVLASIGEAAGIDESRRDMEIEADRRTRQWLVEMREDSSSKAAAGAGLNSSSRWSNVMALPALKHRLEASATFTELSIRLSPRTLEIMASVDAPGLAEAEARSHEASLRDKSDLVEALGKLAVIKRRREYRRQMAAIFEGARRAVKQSREMQRDEAEVRCALIAENNVSGTGAVMRTFIDFTERLQRLAIEREAFQHTSHFWLDVDWAQHERHPTTTGASPIAGLRGLHWAALLEKITYGSIEVKRDEALWRSHIIMEERSCFAQLRAVCRAGIPEEERQWRSLQNRIELEERERRGAARAVQAAQALRDDFARTLDAQREQLELQRQRVLERVHRAEISQASEAAERIAFQEGVNRMLKSCEDFEVDERRFIITAETTAAHALMVDHFIARFCFAAVHEISQCRNDLQRPPSRAEPPTVGGVQVIDIVPTITEDIHIKLTQETERRVEKHLAAEHETSVQRMRQVFDDCRAQLGELKMRRTERLASRAERVLRAQGRAAQPAVPQAAAQDASEPPAAPS